MKYDTCLNGFTYHNDGKNRTKTIIYYKCAIADCTAKLSVDSNGEILKMNGLSVNGKSDQWIDDFVLTNHNHEGDNNIQNKILLLL
jgi:hypothetical protein